MSTNGKLTRKEKELVAVGASIATGCQPCTAHHLKAVREAGATKAEIRQAVDDALCVRNSATKIMTGLAEKHLGNEPPAEESCCSTKPLIGELVSIGAALAVNCATNLETHLQMARTTGATDRQIQTALGVARAVKKVAAQKVEAVVDTAATKVENGCDDICGCNEDNDSQPAANASGDCGCGEEEGVAVIAAAEAKAVTEPCGCG